MQKCLGHELNVVEVTFIQSKKMYLTSQKRYNCCSSIWSIIDVIMWPLSLNATDFLERLRGQRLVFVGDSLNRNMWESLVCILRESIRNKKRVFEISGRREFKKKGVYSFRFEVSFLLLFDISLLWILQCYCVLL